MKRLLLTTAVVLTLTTPALAQEKVFTLKLSAALVNVIGKALNTAPYGEAAPVVQALQMQINEQNAALPPTPPTSSPPVPPPAEVPLPRPRPDSNK